MRYDLLCASLAIALTAVALPAQAITDEELEKKFDAAVVALEKYPSEKACQTISQATVSTTLVLLYDNLQKSQEFARDNPATSWRVQRAEGAIRNLAFGLGDAALKKECLDEAEHQYRNMVTLFSGPGGAGYRDRARIGLDDIREKRSSLTYKAKSLFGIKSE